MSDEDNDNDWLLLTTYVLFCSTTYTSTSNFSIQTGKRKETDMKGKVKRRHTKTNSWTFWLGYYGIMVAIEEKGRLNSWVSETCPDQTKQPSKYKIMTGWLYSMTLLFSISVYKRV